MEMTYRLPVKSGVNVPAQPGISSISLDSAEVSWETTQGKLSTVVLRIFGQRLRFDDRGVILSTYPELESHAYRLSTYIANCVFKQTGFDAIDPETVLLGTPELHAETAEEKDALTHHRRTVRIGKRALYNIHSHFEPEEYPTLFKHSAAVALYADGLRVRSPFQQYELFYKVIEYFFPNKDGSSALSSKALDKAVSSHAHRFDDRFSEPQIKELRELRNRAIHPYTYPNIGPHANPEDLQALRKVEAALPLLRDLARLLLQYPTF